MNTPGTDDRAAAGGAYAADMMVSAHDVARVLGRELPGVGSKKLHKLLYLSQGHHLAMLGTPLFHEDIRAYDMGPVVDRLWRDEHHRQSPPPVELDEAALNTIAYVISRYGTLSGRDLEILSHGQEPWRRASGSKRRGGDDLIDHASMRAYFAETDLDPDDDLRWPDEDVIREWLGDPASRRGDSRPKPDDIDRLRLRTHGG